MNLKIAEKISGVNPAKKLFRGVKDKLKPVENDLILVFVIVFVGLIAFGLGRLSVISERKTPIKIEQADLTGSLSNTPNTTPGVVLGEEKMYVGSKSATKYHFPWCPGAQSIKEENKVWFSSKEEAEKSGYSPAGNCKGL